jgi:hypothetical protein
MAKMAKICRKYRKENGENNGNQSVANRNIEETAKAGGMAWRICGVSMKAASVAKHRHGVSSQPGAGVSIMRKCSANWRRRFRHQ